MPRQKNAGTVGIRLDLRGQEELKRRLEALGVDGKRVFNELMRSAKPVSKEFDIAGQSVMVLTDNVRDLAAQAGPLGQMFANATPKLLLFGAALGALTVAVRGVFDQMDRARETAFFVEQLENTARAAGIAESRVFNFSTALELAGGEASTAMRALEEFSKRVGEFRTQGNGEAADAFEAMGLTALGESSAPIEEVLDRVLDQLSEIEDPARRLALADKLGLRDANALLQVSSDELSQMLETAEEINAVFSDEMLRRLGETADRIREADLRRERADQSLSVAFADLEVYRAELHAGFAERLAALAARRQSVEERTTEQLELQSVQLRMMIDDASRFVNSGLSDIIPGVTGLATQQIQSLIDDLNEIEDERRRRATQSFAPTDLSAAVDSYTDMIEGWMETNEEAILPLEQRRQIEAQLEQQIRATMTPLERYQEILELINTARANGIEITDEQIRRIREHYESALLLSGELSKLTEEEEKLFEATSEASAAFDRQKQLLESMTAPVEDLQLRLLDLYAVLKQSPEHADLITAEIERVKALLNPETDEPERRNERFSGLRKIAEDAQDLAGLLDREATGSVREFGSILRDLRNDTISVGDAFERMSERIVDSLASIVEQRYILGPLSQMFSSFLDGAFGGAKTGGGTGTGVSAGVMHIGGKVGSGGKTRNVSPTVFSGAPRMHTGGLLPGEVPIIGKVGERMLNPSEDTALMRLLDRLANQRSEAPGVNAQMDPGKLELVLKDETNGSASMEERRGPNGTRQLHVMLRNATRASIANGEFDDVFQNRFGVTRTPGRR